MTNNRFLHLMSCLSLVALCTMGSLAWAGGGGGGEPPTFYICDGGPSAGLECPTVGQCPNGLCIETHLLPDLPRICKSGPDKGMACSQNEDCTNSLCVVDFVAKKPLTVHGALTLIVDDDETNYDSGEPCGASTVLLEVEKGAQRYSLAQTFVCLRPDTAPEVEFLRTEGGLFQAVKSASLLNRLLFRGPDGGPFDAAAGELAQDLRDLFGTMGHPVVTEIETPAKVLPENFTDRKSSMVASVVRVNIAIRFVRD